MDKQKNTINPPKNKCQIKEEVSYHRNGKLNSKILYVNGKKHGVSTYWWKEGPKWVKEIWNKGKEHGLKTKWYESGQKYSEEMWIDGKLHGAQTYWWRNGRKQMELHFFQDRELSRIFFDKEGGVTEINFPSQPTPPSAAKTKTTLKTISKPTELYTTTNA